MALAGTPARGAEIAIEHAGRTVSATVDALFIPPGCEENCVGTVFVTET